MHARVQAEVCKLVHLVGNKLARERWLEASDGVAEEVCLGVR